MQRATWKELIKKISALSTMTKLGIKKSLNRNQYSKSTLCEFTQSPKEEKKPIEPPKIDVKKELAKRIGTGEQTASIDFSAKIRYNIYVSNLCHNGTYPIYIKKGMIHTPCIILFSFQYSIVQYATKIKDKSCFSLLVSLKVAPNTHFVKLFSAT